MYSYKYSITKYIGWHGDAERRKVIACRIGDEMNLKYQWYHKSEIVDECLSISLNSGDMYIMSGKAVATDWKKRNSYTLRHAANK